ncbi:MAG TPA: hypothetical protein VN948_21170 [Terriglobales bacterium]|nr:hypothetical protein [Terriglobales bacterium]
MLVRCEKCGYENFPQHRFCGMCAAELRLPGPGGAQPVPPPKRVPSSAVPPPAVLPPAVPPPKEIVPQQVSGPSFLGLGNEPSDARSFSYLLEDESPSHRGRNLILILLIAAVAAAAWHWRQDLRVVASRFLNSPPPAANASRANDNQDPNSSSPAGPDSTSEAVPANGANAGTQVEKPSTGAGDQGPAAQAQTPPSAAPAAAAGSSSADSAQSPQADQLQPSSQAQPNSSAATAVVAKPHDSEEGASQPGPARKSPQVRARPATASASKVDTLETEGERYLYGNGVPENCARARKNLLAAAQHSNANAENVLGTMYATGHCATRDLPTAYRWFGRSLHQDPGNTRIEQDLKVLWNQMTPEERKLALRSER